MKAEIKDGQEEMKAGLEEIKATVMARQDKVKAPISSD
jgi:hypothetical protein